MVEHLDDLPPGTLGFRLSGRLTRDEYTQQLIPAFRGAVERGDKIKMVVILGPEFHGLDAGALLEDLKAAVDLGIRHRSSFEKAAIVTDLDWVRRGSELFGWLSPGELRAFGLGELDDAKAWVAG